jgi:hypothetical protein
MIVDDGNKTKTNRLHLFSPEYQFFGAGISFHATKDFMCHIVLTSELNSFDQPTQIQKSPQRDQ